MKNFLEQILTKNILAILLIGLSFLGLIKYINYRFDFIATQIESINNSVIVAGKAFDNKIKNLGELFLGTLTEEQRRNNSLEDKLSGITDTVENLEKLSATDKELLKKYSKVYFLNEHYVPISLTDIDQAFVSEKGKNFKIHSDVWPHLEELLEDAQKDKLDLQVLSAYRSFATQSSLKSSYTFTYGAGTANKFSADQGYSEHQLGTTVDFTTTQLAGALEGFDKTPEYKWLLENAHNYGFILSYPAGNAYYKFEPWHWRFVGVDLARKAYKDEMNFYDMDQRVIDSYLGKIFD